MTKTVKKLLICLMAFVMTVCSGIALLGLNKTVAKAESTYDISILDTSLSDSNLTFDSSDNANVLGSITYSPEENKLTLNNFKFSGPRNAHVIFVQKSTSTTLTVELIGDSEITITENTSSSSTAISAFYASESGKICFVGGGSFTVDNSAFDSSTAALQGPSKDIFVYNSQLVGKGYNTAIYYDYRIVAYGENASILATATDPESTNVFGSLWIYPALARSGGAMYSNVNGQKVEVSYNIDGSNPSSTVSNDRRTYASYKYFHIVPVAYTVSAYKTNEIGVYYNFTPSTLWYGDKVTVTPEPGYVLTNIEYTTSSYQPKATLQPDGSYVLDTADANNTQYNTIKFWATYAEAKIITKTPSVGGDYVVPSAGVYNKVVTIIPTPNAGYCIDKVTVTSASGNPITVTGPNADGAYTFVMPKEEVSVSVDFKQLITYDVWVAGFRLDSRNLTIDRKDNYAITGSAIYDPTSNTLTLDDFSYTGAGYNIGATTYALIYSTGIDLKIVLKGTNKLAGTGDYQLGILTEDGSLTIAGSDTASLKLTVDDLCIYADYSLSIENVKLTTTTTNLPMGNSSPTQAIYTEGDLSIMSSEVTVIAGDSDGDGIIELGFTQGIISDVDVEIIGSIVTVAANGGGIGAWNRMAIDDSTVIIDGGIGGTSAAATSIKDSTVTISGEIAIETNTMSGGYFILSNSNVELSAQEYAIHDWCNDEPLADDRLDDITGHVIYGGEDKASATMLTEQANIFSNKYLRFAPASSVTVNYGIDGVDNKEFKIKKGTTISLENPEIDGYALIGWYNEDTFETAFDFSTPITENITIYAKLIAVYDVWVAGIRFNAENLIIDSEDNNEIEGSATYDPTSNTLTLDNFSYTGTDYYCEIEHEEDSEYYYYNYISIYSKGDLNIALNGESTLDCAITDDDSDYIEKKCVGINVDGALTISGGTLNATIDGNSIIANTLTIDNATLNSNCTCVNVSLDGDAVISNSKVFAKGGSPVIKIGSNKELQITNSIVVIQSEDSDYGFIYKSAININENSVLEISVSNCAIGNPIPVNYSPNSVVLAGENKENAQLVADPDNNTTFASKYVKIAPIHKITLNFSSVGLPSEEVFVISYEPAIIETPVIDGYVFIGWYKEDTLENAFDFSTLITENITIYAKFANYTEDIADINSQISGVKDSITSLQSSIDDGKADAAELANKVTDLQGKIDALTNNYKSADDKQQLEIDTLKQQVSTLINDTIVLLNSKVTNIETEIADIKTDISTNAGNITANAGKITSLTTQLTALQGLVNSLGDTYIDNTELASLKAELVDADNQIKGLITALTEKVTDIETEIADINNAISTNAGDITANADKITSLTTNLTALQSLVNSLGDTYIDNTELTTAINNLKTELAGVDTEIKGLIETLTAKVTGIESEIANINGAISSNAGGITANADKITSLTTNLTALQGLVNSLGDTYIDNDELSSLKDALELADKGLNDLITALTTRVEKTESDIANLVSNKADVTLVTEKVEELKGLINSLDAIKNNYKTADAELKQDLESQIADAKTYALNIATTLVNNAKAELNSVIALKADTATVTAKFNEVEAAIDILQELSDDYVSADSALKEELTTLITNTKEEIIELILAGDKANADALEEEIAKLRAEIEALKNATNKDIKEAESNAQVLPTVIASVAVLGDIALLVWLIFKRKIVK